jgi:hypothetical protein
MCGAADAEVRMADKLAMRCHLRGGCAETGCHIPTGRVGLGQPDDLASRPNAGGLYGTRIERRHDMLVPRRAPQYMLDPVQYRAGE